MHKFIQAFVPRNSIINPIAIAETLALQWRLETAAPSVWKQVHKFRFLVALAFDATARTALFFPATDYS